MTMNIIKNQFATPCMYIHSMPYQLPATVAAHDNLSTRPSHVYTYSICYSSCAWVVTLNMQRAWVQHHVSWVDDACMLPVYNWPELQRTASHNVMYILQTLGKCISLNLPWSWVRIKFWTVVNWLRRLPLHDVCAQAFKVTIHTQLLSQIRVNVEGQASPWLIAGFLEKVSFTSSGVPRNSHKGVIRVRLHVRKFQYHTHFLLNHAQPGNAELDFGGCYT